MSLYSLDEGGGISKFDLGTHLAKTLYNFHYNTGGLAVDATNVYWADYDDGVIYRDVK